MAKTANLSPDVDTYIEKSADFARPILTRLRKLFHHACPQIEEKLKWGVPSFEYKGMVGGMAAFKKHVNFGFWKAQLMDDPAGILGDEPGGGMTGSKFTAVDQLPSDNVLVDYIKRAVALNEAGVKLPRAKAGPRDEKAAAPPPDFAAALRKNKAAGAAFKEFSYSHRKEYVEWITEAKRPETRAKRISTAVEWLADGKSRNWKYERC